MKFVAIYMSLLFLLLFGFLVLFPTQYLFEAGKQYGIEPMVNSSLQYAQINNLSSTMKTVISDTETNYNNTVIPYDLIFITGVIFLFIANVVSSFKARKEGFLSFFGLVTIGNMMFFLILTILEDVRVWLFDNFIYSVFGNGVASTPLIDAFYNNFGVIAVIWIGLMLLINQFDSDLLERNRGRFEE